VDFARPCECEKCGRRYLLKGQAANPGNETQAAHEFRCESCGGRVMAHVPGSANRAALKLDATDD
jgi:DNA-directed RNA polymerase subunit RPC12/RpoP